MVTRSCVCAAITLLSAATLAAQSSPAPVSASTTDSILAAAHLLVPASALPPRGAYQHRDSLQVVYDPIKDATSIRVIGMDVGSNLQLSMFAGFDGREPKKVPIIVALVLASRSPEWRFLRDHEVYLLMADSTRLDYPMSHEGTVERGGVVEIMKVAMPIGDAVALVKAGNAEGEIAGDHFRITRDQVQAIADLLSRLAPASQ